MTSSRAYDALLGNRARPPRRALCTRSVAKAEKEFEEVTKQGGDLSRFSLQRLPLRRIARLAVLPLFDHVEPHEPELYSLVEELLFGGADWPEPGLEELLAEGRGRECVEALRSRVEVPADALAPPTTRCTINETSLLDYASRVGMTRDQARELVRRHGVERFKPRDVQIVNGRIVALESAPLPEE